MACLLLLNWQEIAFIRSIEAIKNWTKKETIRTQFLDQIMFIHFITTTARSVLIHMYVRLDYTQKRDNYWINHAYDKTNHSWLFYILRTFTINEALLAVRLCLFLFNWKDPCLCSGKSHGASHLSHLSQLHWLQMGQHVQPRWCIPQNHSFHLAKLFIFLA